jgi:hypothetical protein
MKKRRLMVIVALAALVLACGPTASAGPSSPASGPTGSLPPTSFSFSGATMTATAVTCTREHTASDVPLALDFSGTARGDTYDVLIGGTNVASGTTSLTSGAAFGVTFIRKSDETFWAAPLKAPGGGDSGSVTLTLTDLDASGLVDAVVVQEVQGVASPGGTTIHLTGTFGCAFP